MINRCVFTALLMVATLANVGCVMFDGADDFPQPCYGPDCMGGGLAQYGNARYGHTGGYIGEPVFTPAAPVIPGGAPLPPGVGPVILNPDAPSTKTATEDVGTIEVEPIDIPSPPPAPPTPQP